MQLRLQLETSAVIVSKASTPRKAIIFYMPSLGRTAEKAGVEVGVEGAVTELENITTIDEDIKKGVAAEHEKEEMIDVTALGAADLLASSRGGIQHRPQVFMKEPILSM